MQAFLHKMCLSVMLFSCEVPDQDLYKKRKESPSPWPRSSAFEANCTVLCHAVLSRTMPVWSGVIQCDPLCKRSSTLVQSEPKRTTMVPFWYASWVRCVAYQWDTVRICIQTVHFGTLWTTLGSGPPLHASRPVQHGNGLL